MNNKGLLVVIALALIGILGVMVVQYRESQKSPMEKIGEGIGDATKNVGDDIKDATDGK